jgi:hypothetical protein
MDSQSVKTLEETTYPSYYDAYKRMSKGANGTSWWTPWGFSLFTLPRPTLYGREVSWVVQSSETFSKVAMIA